MTLVHSIKQVESSVTEPRQLWLRSRFGDSMETAAARAALGLALLTICSHGSANKHSSFLTLDEDWRLFLDALLACALLVHSCISFALNSFKFVTLNVFLPDQT